MDLNAKVLSDIIIFGKYSKYRQDLSRREIWKEICIRNRDMHIKKYPQLKDKIIVLYDEFVIPMKVLPSMRSMQFAGKPIELSPNRGYNCAFVIVNDYRVFSEIMFLLLGGTGVGYSVQKHHITELPPIKKPIRNRRFLIADSIEGWADAVKALVSAYLCNKPMPRFDFSDIREKGILLKTSGGKAPGPQPLKDCLHNLQKILDSKKDGEQLKPIEVHDMVCYIADAVLAGGIRRAALLSLFSFDDEEMIGCKFGNWWELNPQRGRANNTALVLRHKIQKEEFFDFFEKVKASRAGEPGINFSNNSEWGLNPCLAGDTKVAIADGENIHLTLKEMTESGKDYPVYCLDDNENIVIRQFKNIRVTGKDKKLIKITLNNGETIRCTPNHKFRLYNGEWRQAQELEKSDSLWQIAYYEDLKKCGNKLSCKILHVQEENETKDVYCGEVADFHNFFVGGRKIKFNNTFAYMYGNVGNCGEIALRNAQFCNLVEINFSDLTSPEDLDNRARAAAFLGTLQAGYTDFHYLRDIWRRTTEKEALLGVSGTGIASEAYLHCDLIHSVNEVKKENVRVAKIIDINTAARQTAIKPAGCLDPSIKIRTNMGNLSLKEIFEFNGYNLEEHKNSENLFLPRNKDIYVYDENNALQLITRLYINGNSKVFKIYFENGTIVKCTAKHKFLVPTKNYDVWKTAKNIVKNDLIYCYDKNDFKKIKVTKVVELKKEIFTVDLEVANTHTYQLESGIISHNTTSCVLGTSSGIHAWFDKFYIRRITINKNEPLYPYLLNKIPELIEDNIAKPHLEAFVKIPMRAPEEAIIARDESAFQLLERIKKFSIEWVKPGHVKGDNTHNVSSTVYVKDHEWDEVRDWMWNNKEYYNCLTVLPYDGGTYVQMPFESITEEDFNKLSQYLVEIDLSEVTEYQDDTNLGGELACAGGSCEIK